MYIVIKILYTKLYAVQKDCTYSSTVKSISYPLLFNDDYFHCNNVNIFTLASSLNPFKNFT